MCQVPVHTYISQTDLSFTMVFHRKSLIWNVKLERGYFLCVFFCGKTKLLCACSIPHADTVLYLQDITSCSRNFRLKNRHQMVMSSDQCYLGFKWKGLFTMFSKLRNLKIFLRKKMSWVNLIPQFNFQFFRYCWLFFLFICKFFYLSQNCLTLLQKGEGGDGVQKSGEGPRSEVSYPSFILIIFVTSHFLRRAARLWIRNDLFRIWLLRKFRLRIRIRILFQIGQRRSPAWESCAANSHFIREITTTFIFVDDYINVFVT
jgi:hypothetical protein